MQTILIGFIVIVLVGMIISAIMALAACMLSSRISQRQEQLELERRLNGVFKQQDTYKSSSKFVIPADKIKT